MSIPEAEPTAKYIAYLAEVQEALAGPLRPRERRRREAEFTLLQRARFIQLNGITHHYQDVGPPDGPPIILIHGWDCSALWWHHVVGPLTESGYRVICYDLKGHGFSDKDPHNNYTVTSFSADLQQLTQALALKPHHTVSFSLGAVVALHYAATTNGQVRSLTFFNFGLFTHNPIAMKIIPVGLDLIFNKILRPLTRRGLWIVPFVYARLAMAKNTPLVSDIKLGTLGVRLCDPEAVRVSAKQMANRAVLQAIPQQMATITQPVLLVTGKEDPVTGPKSGRKLMSVAQHGIFMEIPRCGHIILFELPDLVVQILRLHLRAAECYHQ